jgi:hypothetical protein
MLSTSILATTTRSVLLQHIGRFRVLPYTTDLASTFAPDAAPETFPTLSFRSFQRCHHPARRGENRVQLSELPRSQRTSLRNGSSSLLDCAFDVLMFALATAPLFARTPWRALNHRACEVRSHLLTPSVFATAPFGQDTDRTYTGKTSSRYGLHHSLALTRSVSSTTAGTLPSRRVVRHGVRSRGSLHVLRYHDPLGLPLRGARLRLRLIRAALS